MRISVFCIFIFLVTALGMQAQGERDRSYPSKEERTSIAAEQIRSLQNGVLLVRLSTKQNSIDAMEQKGLSKQADVLRQKVLAENLEIASSFKTSFNFCPVYFFYSHDSKHVMNGNLDSVTFMNSELKAYEIVEFENNNYFTAEFTLLAQNTKYREQNIPKGQEDNPNYTREAKYYGGANMRFHALIIKDQQFNQLERPFPFYSRTLNSFFMKKKTEEVVSVLNEKLFAFYNSKR